MSYELLSAELRQVTYKPGWRFVLYQHPWEGIWISIIAELPDSHHPGRTTVVNIRSAIPPMSNFSDFHSWVMWRLGRIELHEMREFYKVDGHVIDDPHAPDANE